jgi:hypothetical protein
VAADTMDVRPRGVRLHRTVIDPRIWVLAALYAVVIATNSGFAQPPTDDALDYRRIADAAPQLPSNPLVASAFTARLSIHYLVGLVHKGTGLALDTTYNVVFAVLMVLLLAVVHLLFRSLPVGDFAFAAALFIFDPYSFRPYLLQTETLQDPVFVLGIGICLLGMRVRSTRVLLLGLVVALLGRQTAVVAAPVLAAWVLLDPRWRSQSDGRRAWPTAAAALAVTAVLFMAIRILCARFSIHFEPTGLHDTVFNLVSGLPGTATEMAAHFARLAVPLLVPLAVFGTLAAVVGWRRVPLASWACLALCVAIIAQPAVTDPRFPGFAFNEQRLAALGLLPLVYGIAVLLGQTRRRRPGPWLPLLLVGILSLESLHHEFSWFGPQSLAQFLAVQLAAATAVAALLFWDRRPAGAQVDRLPGIAHPSAMPNNPPSGRRWS